MNRKLTIILLSFCCTLQLLASGKTDPSPGNTDSKNDITKGIFSGTTESNIISNAGFENKTSTWSLGKYNGGTGLFSTDTLHPISGDRSAFIFTTNQQQDFNDVQLFTFFKLSNKASYSISFEADVKSACLISISVGNGFETFFEEKFLLRPDTKFYGPFNFKSTIDDPFSFFAFNLGKTNNKIRFDDIVIQADHTEREFNAVITNSGINVNLCNTKDGNSIYISSPTETASDLPVILYDDNKNVIYANKIIKGSKEANITLNNKLVKGNYQLKVFTPEKQETFSFSID